jgi:hypothetical protein
VLSGKVCGGYPSLSAPGPGESDAMVECVENDALAIAYGEIRGGANSRIATGRGWKGS